jgi:hypothetical protein
MGANNTCMLVVFLSICKLKYPPRYVHVEVVMSGMIHDVVIIARLRKERDGLFDYLDSVALM